MSDGPAAPARPPAVRLWAALQTLTRLRDGFTREPDPAAKVKAAREMVERADEVGRAAAELLAEAEGAGNGNNSPEQ